MAETTTTTHIATAARPAVRALNLYIRDEIAPIDRKSVFMGEIKSRGQLEFNKGGNQLEFRPTLKRRTINPISGDPTAGAFKRTTVKKVAQLPWRGYDLREYRTRFEELVTQGEAGYFGPMAKILKGLSKDFLEDFRTKFYIDGGATGSKDMHGLESWFANTGSCITDSVFADPDDSYAGIDTDLGVTGSWTAESGNGWPTGTGDVEYHSWSPFIVDYNNTGLEGSTANWTNQWEYALNQAVTFMEILQTVTPDICLMSGSLLTKAKNSLRGDQRFTTTADSNLTRLGYKTLEFNGIEIASEYGIPTAVAYLLTWEKLHLWCMQSQIIEVEEDKDIRTGEKLTKLSSYCQLWTDSPAYHGKLEAISTAGT